jgi:hypothetical protein
MPDDTLAPIDELDREMNAVRPSAVGEFTDGESVYFVLFDGEWCIVNQEPIPAEVKA